MMTNDRCATGLLVRSAVIVIAGLGAGTAYAAEPISVVDYACAEGKTIKASYYSDKVDIVLSDGRKMELPQTMSGSGIRYANADESFVFWSKGNTAFATEGDPDKPTYADCVQK